MNGPLPCKENQNIPEQLESSSDYELMAQQENYLSRQLNSAPFLLYKYWLVINFPISLYLIVLTIQTLNQSFESLMRIAGPVVIGFLLFFYGCGQMFYAMNMKKSRIAQESYLKFQYALIILVGSVKDFLDLDLETEEGMATIIYWSVLIYIVFSPILHLVGGFAVIQVFKKNHPVMRISTYKQASGDENKDFLQQNEALASEFARYDKQLNSCPYFVFNCLLMFTVAFALRSLFGILGHLGWTWELPQHDIKAEFGMYLLSFGSGISCVLNAYFCFQMEVAMRTRSLDKSKRAITWLKICVVLSVIKCLVVGKQMDFRSFLDVFQREFLWWFVVNVICPVLSLIGALKVKKVLEERDNFVKASSYSQDLYL